MSAATSAVVSAEEALAVLAQARSTRSEAHDLRAEAANVRAMARALRSRLLMRPLAGGSRNAEADASIRARIRALIAAGKLPQEAPARVWAGLSHGDRQCEACDVKFAPGETEYEVTTAATTLYLHIRCFEFWAAEAEQKPNDKSGAPGGA